MRVNVLNAGVVTLLLAGSGHLDTQDDEAPRAVAREPDDVPPKPQGWWHRHRARPQTPPH